MADQDLISTLTDVGLNENQARVYLASLSLGPARPVAIAQAAGIKRTTVYPVIESLKQAGVMSEHMKGFKKLYFAESPERLFSLVEMRQRRLKESLASLSAIHRMRSGESAIKYYEGLEAIKGVYNSLLEDIRPKEDYRIISSPQAWYELDPEFFQDFIHRRSQLDINIRIVLLDSPVGRDYKKNEVPYNLKAKIFPKNVSFTANIVIIPQRLLIHQLVSPVWAIVIENRDIIRTLSELFDIIWDVVPEIK